MNILLVEDEPRVADFIRRGLKAESWLVEHANTGEAALSLMDTRRFDVVILDLILPGISGQDVCKVLRSRDDMTPILMLTALGTTDERVAGLKLGADDYLVKPFDFEELIARVAALARRAKLAEKKLIEEAGRCDPVLFDNDAMQLFVDGKPIDLSIKERDLVVLFLSNRSKVISRERILNAIWDTQEDPLTNVVDVYVGRIRKKFGSHGERIVTVRGIGYRFD